VYRRELNEARGILAGSSIVKTASSSPEEAILDPTCMWGRFGSYLRSLSDRELSPCVSILTRSSNITRIRGSVSFSISW
jgi:hypothetical protein